MSIRIQCYENECEIYETNNSLRRSLKLYTFENAITVGETFELISL